MLIYYNAIIMKQGSGSIFCTGPFMSHHDSVLSQKSGTTGLRTGSLFCTIVLYLSPGAPLEFPPSLLSPASKPPRLLYFGTAACDDLDASLWAFIGDQCYSVFGGLLCFCLYLA